MAVKLPPFLMPLVFQLLAVVPGLVQQAETAFSGEVGSGPAKKQFVMDGATAVLSAMGTIKPGMLSKAQSDAIMQTVSSIVDAIVLALNTAKLFEAPKV